MKKVYKIPNKNRIARVFLRPIFRGIFRILGKVELSGLENIPREGAYLVASNHISIFDGPFVLVFWPVPLEVAGASEIWERPGQSQLIRMYGGIPVHRGKFDRNLVEATLSVLQAGKPLMIAPEGTRSGEPGLQRAHPGVAYLMDKAEVPVLPVGVFGSTVDFVKKGLRGERPKIGMQIGKQVKFLPVSGKGAERREKRQRNADLVMAKIADLLPKEYRGVYSDHELLSI